VKNGRNIRKVLGLALIGLMIAGVPAHAKFWRIFGGILCTVSGVISGSTGNIPIGVALIGLQGVLLKDAAVVASDPTLKDLTNVQPSYAAVSNPQFCDDGSLTCPAAQALLRMEVAPIEVDPSWSTEEIAFVTAANRVIEDGNLFALHSREGASLAEKTQDLQLMASSLEAAAEAYDHLNLSLSLTQSDVSEFQSGIESSGLPRAEQSFWESSNLTPAEVDAIAQFLATADLKLGVPAVSVSRILHEEAVELAPAQK